MLRICKTKYNVHTYVRIKIIKTSDESTTET